MRCPVFVIQTTMAQKPSFAKANIDRNGAQQSKGNDDEAGKMGKWGWRRGYCAM